MQRLGELERAVMDLLWQRDREMTVREVVRELAAERDLAHTTVMTVLDRLARKGLLRRARDGRAWRYYPAASRESYVAELMLGALDMTGDRDAALTRFVHSVSGEEVGVLRDALGKLDGDSDHGQSDEPPER